MTDNQTCQQDQQITSIADAVVKLKELRESNKNLNEPDIEERFARLSLAFKTDKFTLGKRLDLQRRQRDIAEKNIETELGSLRESLNALNQLCTESDMREVITKTQQHVDIVQQATLRMSNRAETYGAIQQEERLNCVFETMLSYVEHLKLPYDKEHIELEEYRLLLDEQNQCCQIGRKEERLNCAFETMLNYVEHLKLLYDKEHIELEDYRRLLAEHNLLPGEKGPSVDDDPRRTVLPPRSHSLSSTSKPEFIRRGSLGAFIRPPHTSDNHKVISRENSAGHLNINNLNLVKQKLESRTRLLSSVCLLNNNYESPRTPPNGNSTTPVSPKSRRSSLPVGPLSSNHTTSTILPSPRTHHSIHEMSETKKEKMESPVKASVESETQKTSDAVSVEESSKEAQPEEIPVDKDSSELSFTHLLPPDHDTASNSASSLQDSACDNEIEDVCLLPEISIPIRPPKPLYLLKLVQWVSLQRIWRWDNATLILHARYTLSVMLATAAMLTFVLTFVPNQVLAHGPKD